MSVSESQKKRPFPIVIVGHVDHGKSTLIGRLLFDTGSLPEGKVEEIKQVSEKRGQTFEWAFLMDALQVERDQGVTVDASHIWFKSKKRPYVIIDAPGHRAFITNMITGAASAEAAIIVVDAEQGICEQTRHHSYLLRFLGFKKILVTVNKMDKIGWDGDKFDALVYDLNEYFSDLGLPLTGIVPISARHGDNIAKKSEKSGWYDGKTLIKAVDDIPRSSQSAGGPFRLPVQDIYKRGDERIIAGRIENGRLKVGDKIRVAPTGEEASIVQFKSWPENAAEISAVAGKSVAVTLDRDLFIDRGHILHLAADKALHSSHRLLVQLYWFGKAPLKEGQNLQLRLGQQETIATIEEIRRSFDIQSLTYGQESELPQHGMGEVVLRCRNRLAFDLASELAETSRGVLLDNDRIAGAVTISESLALADQTVQANITRVKDTVTGLERAEVFGHRGGVLWMTGLSGAGKSTLSMAVQRRLFERGYHVYVLDGDNVRHGLTRDLGFSAKDRSENIRRVAEAAKLIADSGAVVLAAFISPYRADRTMARDIIGEDFREIHVSADISVCEERDPKGLYAKARAGEIEKFTGVSDVYEEPLDADLEIDTGKEDIQTSVDHLISFVQNTYAIDRRKAKSSG